MDFYLRQLGFHPSERASQVSLRLTPLKALLSLADRDRRANCLDSSVAEHRGNDVLGLPNLRNKNIQLVCPIVKKDLTKRKAF